MLCAYLPVNSLKSVHAMILLQKLLHTQTGTTITACPANQGTSPGGVA